MCGICKLDIDRHAKNRGSLREILKRGYSELFLLDPLWLRTRFRASGVHEAEGCGLWKGFDACCVMPWPCSKHAHGVNEQGLARYISNALCGKLLALRAGPHVAKVDLWKTSGHYDFYRENMFDQMDIEDEQYQLRPM